MPTSPDARKVLMTRGQRNSYSCMKRKNRMRDDEKLREKQKER